MPLIIYFWTWCIVPYFYLVSFSFHWFAQFYVKPMWILSISTWAEYWVPKECGMIWNLNYISSINIVSLVKFYKICVFMKFNLMVKIVHPKSFHSSKGEKISEGYYPQFLQKTTFFFLIFSAAHLFITLIRGYLTNKMSLFILHFRTLGQKSWKKIIIWRNWWQHIFFWDLLTSKNLPKYSYIKEILCNFSVLQHF